jgi:hypothetical protein
MRAFGSDLRRYLSTAFRNRFIAFLAGVGVTALLQNSTATALAFYMVYIYDSECSLTAESACFRSLSINREQRIDHA